MVDLDFDRKLEGLRCRTYRPFLRQAVRELGITRNSALQTLQCNVCDELKEYGRSTANNPEAMALLVERVTVDHEDCSQWAHDPERAKRERGVKVRMRREFARQRCTRRLF